MALCSSECAHGPGGGHGRRSVTRAQIGCRDAGAPRHMRPARVAPQRGAGGGARRATQLSPERRGLPTISSNMDK
eukprot:4645076-Prymnesium_polylepis.2